MIEIKMQKHSKLVIVDDNSPRFEQAETVVADFSAGKQGKYNRAKLSTGYWSKR